MNKRPGWITFFGVWQFIIATSTLLSGMGLASGSKEDLALGIFLIILGGLSIAVGYGLLNLKNWARITVIILDVQVFSAIIYRSFTLQFKRDSI